MRTKEFEVPTDIIVAFSEALIEHELTNEITGTTEDDDIVIEVSYDKDEREKVFILSEMIDDYLDENEVEV